MLAFWPQRLHSQSQRSSHATSCCTAGPSTSPFVSFHVWLPLAWSLQAFSEGSSLSLKLWESHAPPRTAVEGARGLQEAESPSQHGEQPA